MSSSRKRYGAEFKAKVALEALRGDLTVAQLATKYGVHPTMVAAWKKQAVEGLSGVFSGKTEAAATARADEIGRLHAKIGQLVVERDFYRRPLVDEPGPEAADDRGRSSEAVGCPPVRARLDQPLGVLRSACG